MYCLFIICREYSLLFPFINLSCLMWEDGTRHWISLVRTIISSENIQRQSEVSFPWTVETGVRGVSYPWLLLRLRTIITCITALGRERKAQKIWLSPTFRVTCKESKQEEAYRVAARRCCGQLAEPLINDHVNTELHSLPQMWLEWYVTKIENELDWQKGDILHGLEEQARKR